MTVSGMEARIAVFALIALPDLTAQLVRHELLAITDPENGCTPVENRRIDLRAAAFVDAVRTAGNDQTLAPLQLAKRGFTWLDFGVDTQVTNLPGNEMTILAACVQNGDLGRRRVGLRSRALQILPAVVLIDALHDQLLGLIQ